MKRIFYNTMTLICGALFIFSLCALESLNPLVIAALFASEAWLLHAMVNVYHDDEGREHCDE